MILDTLTTARDEAEALLADNFRLRAMLADRPSTFGGDWQSRWRAKITDGAANIVQVDDPDRGTVLELRVPQGERMGMGMFLPLPPLDSVTRTLDVYFPADYEWVSLTDPDGKKHGGGKIPPGMAGVPWGAPEYTCGGGGERWIWNPTTGTATRITRKSDVVKATGYSLRLLQLWDRRVQVYLYAPDLAHLGRIDGTEGTDSWRCYGWVKTLTDPATGKPLLVRDGWNRFTLGNTVNTLGKANGVLQAGLNGVVGVNESNIVFRTRPDVHVTHDYLTFYAGGGPADYPTSNRRRISIDALR